MTRSSNPRTLRLTLRTLPGKTRPTKEAVYECTCGQLNAALTGLFETTTGFTALVVDEKTIDCILTEKGKRLLAKINLEPLLPPQIKAQRTVFVKLLDEYVTSRPTDEITDELKRNNILTHDVTKIGTPNRTTLKLTMQSTTDAKKLLTDGMVLFNVRVAPQQCELEDYTHLLICYKCYKYSDHMTKNC